MSLSGTDMFLSGTDTFSDTGVFLSETDVIKCVISVTKWVAIRDEKLALKEYRALCHTPFLDHYEVPDLPHIFWAPRSAILNFRVPHGHRPTIPQGIAATIAFGSGGS